ncbi:MAG: hypothetical protein ACU836_16835 [Gammaproteobacteria bacterium]
MDNRNEKLAQEAVEAFKNCITAEARTLITETEYTELAQIILEALQVQMNEAVELIKELEKHLEERAGRRDMDL